MNVKINDVGDNTIVVRNTFQDTIVIDLITVTYTELTLEQTEKLIAALQNKVNEIKWGF